jgi:hypothetical protein
MRGRVAKSVPESPILVPFWAVFVRGFTVLVQNFPDLAETFFKTECLARQIHHEGRSAPAMVAIYDRPLG